MTCWEYACRWRGSRGEDRMEADSAGVGGDTDRYNVVRNGTLSGPAEEPEAMWFRMEAAKRGGGGREM